MAKKHLTKDQVNKLKRARGLIMSVFKEVEEKSETESSPLFAYIAGDTIKNIVETLQDEVLLGLSAVID